jgi:hypothetical protein
MHNRLDPGGEPNLEEVEDVSVDRMCGSPDMIPRGRDGRVPARLEQTFVVRNKSGTEIDPANGKEGGKVSKEGCSDDRGPFVRGHEVERVETWGAFRCGRERGCPWLPNETMEKRLVRWVPIKQFERLAAHRQHGAETHQATSPLPGRPQAGAWIPQDGIEKLLV